MSQALADKLQIWGFEDSKIIYKDFSLGLLLKLKLRDISCSTDEELNTLHSAICDFLNGLPSGLSLQFVQDISGGVSKILDHHETLSTTQDELTSLLTKNRIDRFKQLDEDGRVPMQSVYLLLRRDCKIKEQKASFKFWKKSNSDISRDVLEPELKSFDQLVQNMMGGLNALGIWSTRVSENTTFELMFNQWNPSRKLGNLNFDKEDVRDELILSDMLISIRGFALGPTHHRVLSLKNMPDQTYASMSEQLQKLPFDSKLFLSIETLNQDREALALETQRRITYAMHAGKNGVSDLESAAKLKDIESLLAKRVTGEEKIFSVALNILLRSESESDLEDQEQRVLQIIRELSGAEGMCESLAAANIFLDFALPNGRARERSRRMNTSVLADFLPIFGDWAGHSEPRVLLRNRRGAVIGFDPFSPSLTNFNQVVSGGSGSGKSFLSNLLIAQAMKEDPKIFILDIGGSYRKMCEILGGQYIDLGADAKISLNPFDLSNSSDEAIDQKIKFMVSLVEIMTKEDQATGIGKLERSEIEQMIKDILRDEKAPRLSHLRNRLLENSEPSLQKLGKILGSWCGDSPYGKFVDRASNIEINKKIVCFDLKNLESQPDLQAVCLFLITDLIWREVQADRTNMKFVLFDECWQLLSNDAGAKFIASVFRTFRKYKASAIAISQSMDDFSKSKVASAILPNASIKWILKQTGGSLASLKETLLLNERESDLVGSVTSKKGQFSEAFLIAGDDKQVVKIESTPIEYWLATTDPQDLKVFEETRTLKPDLSQVALLEFLAQKFPNGASVPPSNW